VAVSNGRYLTMVRRGWTKEGLARAIERALEDFAPDEIVSINYMDQPLYVFGRRNSALITICIRREPWGTSTLPTRARMPAARNAAPAISLTLPSTRRRAPSDLKMNIREDSAGASSGAAPRRSARLAEKIVLLDAPTRPRPPDTSIRALLHASRKTGLLPQLYPCSGL
jgi:hypothetical protein